LVLRRILGQTSWHAHLAPDQRQEALRLNPFDTFSTLSEAGKEKPSLRQASSLSDREGLLGAERLALGRASLGSSSLRSDVPAPAVLAPVEPLGFSSVFSPHKQKSPSASWGFFVCLAEREGFEPSENEPGTLAGPAAPECAVTHRAHAGVQRCA